MNKVSDLTEIVNILENIKASRGKLFTNFYLDRVKHGLWIKNAELFSEHCGDCDFLIRRCTCYESFFYFAGTLTGLRDGLAGFFRIYDNHLPLVADIVGFTNDPVKQVFNNAKFKLYRVLYRMSHVGAIQVDYHQDDNVVYACVDDVHQIKKLLDVFFDAKAEQIPSVEELVRFVSNNQIFVYKDNGKILGFLIYEINGLTLYLRYWFVLEECRDRLIGSKLLKKFFYIGKDSKRQICWVIEDNVNAIERYMHYGLKAENLFDYVMIKND